MTAQRPNPIRRQQAPQLEVLTIPSDPGVAQAWLTVPADARGLVLLAIDGAENPERGVEKAIVGLLAARSLGALITPLLSGPEQHAIAHGAVPDLRRMALRLIEASEWAMRQKRLGGLPMGYLGVGVGAAAALIAAGDIGKPIKAVVVERGRPDLAEHELAKVEAATLLIGGELDWPQVEEARDAFHMMRGQRSLHIVPGARDPFGQAATRDATLTLAADWFARYLVGTATAAG